MKTFFKLLLSLFLLVATALVVKVSLFWWELNHPSPTANLNFIQGATGVRFPPGITQYAEYDDVLGFATAHLTLPHNEIPPFIKQYHFTPTDSRVSSLSDKDVPHLPVPFNKIPSSVNYFLNGQKGEHFWTFVLDSRSGNLWVKVVYPGGIQVQTVNEQPTLNFSIAATTFEFEHIVPRSAGGETAVENICLACPSCNRYKAAQQNI